MHGGKNNNLSTSLQRPSVRAVPALCMKISCQRCLKFATPLGQESEPACPHSGVDLLDAASTESYSCRRRSHGTSLNAASASTTFVWTMCASGSRSSAIFGRLCWHKRIAPSSNLSMAQPIKAPYPPRRLAPSIPPENLWR